MQANHYDSRRKDHILYTSSMKAPDSDDRKTLGGTDRSSADNGCCLLVSQDGGDNDPCEFPGGVGRALVLVNGDDDCMEPGGNRLINSVIVDQSRSCGGSEE